MPIIEDIHFSEKQFRRAYEESTVKMKHKKNIEY
jgi:hypothetical protein